MTEYQKPAFLPQEDDSNSPRNTSHPVNFGTLYLGLTLIILGLVYYYSSTYFSSLRVMVSYARLWPLTMIILGLSLYRSRSHKTFAVGVLITLLAVVTTVSTVLIQDDRLDLKNTQYAVPQESGIEESSVLIENPAGKLTVLGGASSDKVVDVYYESNYAEFNPELTQKDSIAQVSLRQPEFWQGVGSYYKSMTARLTDTVPMSLTVRGAAMSTVMDLSSIQLRELNMTIRASDLNLTLGDKVERSTVSIDSTASAITIFYPDSVGVEIIYSGNVSTTNFEGFAGVSSETEGVYKSQNFDKTSSRSRLTINSNVSRITVVKQ